MPQPSYTYASARLSALSKRLVEPQTVRRMADGTLSDALRTLQDIRYGGGMDIRETNVEQMITAEMRETMAEIRDISPNPTLTDLFLLRSDVQNIKALLKARMLGSSDAPFSDGGLYSKEDLAAMVKEQHYDDLPDELKTALLQLEKQLSISLEEDDVHVYSALHNPLAMQ